MRLLRLLLSNIRERYIEYRDRKEESYMSDQWKKDNL